MRLALRELRRRPGRFVPVGGALVLLVLLLLVLGGFLDGLTLDQTGSYRAQEGRLIAYAEDADLQLGRSRVPATATEEVAQLDGVAAVGSLATIQTTAGRSDDDLQDVVVLGYSLATDVLPAPPDAGEVVVDRQLARLTDVAVGDELAVGPGAVGLEVVALVDDVSQGAPTLWVPLPTWREVAATAAPTDAMGDELVQALVVEPTDGTDLADLGATVSEATDLEAVTVDEAVDALEVVQQQAATFQGIIGVTFVVTLLVVALFFALLTLERVRLYAVLKAMGARTSDLVGTVTTEAVVVAVGAVALGGVLALAFVAVLPPDLPVRLIPGRAVIVAGGTLVTALAGGLFTLRRLLRIDPAQALG